jgi:hypothetical protein
MVLDSSPPAFSSFALRPHPTHAAGNGSHIRICTDMRLDASIGARGLPGGGLLLQAEFSAAWGVDDGIRFPELRAEAPSRCDRLWEATCLELFLAPDDGGGRYWEVNVSPRGDWNVYAFTAYREGMMREERVRNVELETFAARGNGFQCGFRLDLSEIETLATAPRLRVGATAVIETVSGGKSYWALYHPGEKPDFHRREGFLHLLELQ